VSIPISIDPNVAYLILLGGLWLSVTAAYVPGTGIIEVFAGIAVVLSVIVLASMPTNWLAVVAIVIGTSGFFVVPFLDRRYVALALVGLALQVIGSLALFSAASVSLPLIAVITLISLLYYRFALLPMHDANSRKASLIDDEPIIGATGVVQSLIDPVGTVRVRGESWTARSDEPLEPGTEIVVVDMEGLTLFVEAEKVKRQPLEETI
jgi:membrane-bound serine protease (ClpP class)